MIPFEHEVNVLGEAKTKRKIESMKTTNSRDCNYFIYCLLLLDILYLTYHKLENSESRPENLKMQERNLTPIGLLYESIIMRFHKSDIYF